MGCCLSAIVDILDAMAEALDTVVAEDESIQVVGRMNLDPQAPTSIDIYPADPFRGEEATGFGERAGELVFTVRARVTTSDTDTAQNKLLALLDDESPFSVAAALEDDTTLDGLVQQLHVDGDTGYRVFVDPPGAMLGVSWRVRVINLPSEVERVSRNAGAAIVRGPFEFAFDTPGLTTGVPFYTPTVGDVLLNLSIRTVTAWTNHTFQTNADVGQFLSGGTEGLFKHVLGNPQLQIAPDSLGGIDWFDLPGLGDSGFMYMFTTDDPLKLVVTQDGLKGGAANPATAGTSEIYLVTATPAALT